LAIDAPETSARDRHQLRTLIYTITVLLVVLGMVLATVIAARPLNAYPFLFFPLGFYLLAQGLVILIVAATFWFARAQERIDIERGESEEY
jgi:putative solute:sodium symporter small subunit